MRPLKKNTAMNKGVKATQHQIEGCRHARRKKHIMEGKWVPHRFEGAWKMTWRDLWPFILAFVVAIIITILIP